MPLNQSLYDWQVPHAERLHSLLRGGGVAADLSDTGTGKTHCAAAIVRESTAATLVVGPLVAGPTWARGAAFQATDLDFVNYEMVRTGRTPFGRWWTPPGKRKEIFRWASGIELLIFDEFHRCKGMKTQNAQLLLGAALQQIPTLMLSATPATAPWEMRALGARLGWHRWTDFYPWLSKQGCKQNHWGTWEMPDPAATMARLTAQLEQRSARMRIANIPGFPERYVIPQMLPNPYGQKLNVYFEMIEEALQKLQERQAGDRDPDLPLTKILRARQAIELYKAPLLVDLIFDELQQGRSVAVFVAFLDSLNLLKDRLTDLLSVEPSMIYGGQSARQREEQRVRFQENHAPVILLQIKSGDVCMDLHDLYGRPRTGIACLDWSALNFQQLLGRLHRAGALSPALYRVPLFDASVEERVFAALTAKQKNLEILVDGDLCPWQVSAEQLSQINERIEGIDYAEDGSFVR